MQKQVLIVDDEEAVCQMVGKVLASVGMESLALTRSSQALDLLDQEKFDMVFFDLHMAAPDGMELARHLRRSSWNRTTPVILISDDQRPSAMSVGFEAGANFFLYKPIDKECLLKLVRATQGTIDYGRRRTRRVALHSKVKLNTGEDLLEDETVDVSLCGLLVKAGRTLARGTPVRVSMELARRMKPVVAAGSVVRVLDGNRMGIQLAQLSVAESERLQEFLLPLIPIR
jgi:DNA-binding response OmpR family regulator